jgi:hypothetical protein
MLVVQFLPYFAKRAQPWVGWLGNVSLYVLVGATLIGYFPNMVAIIGTGAILVDLMFVATAFGAGYLAGAGKDHLQDVGGLGTAQHRRRDDYRRAKLHGNSLKFMSFGDLKGWI